MPYSLLIGLGAGFVSAVVFASATTGPMFTRLILFLLTPLALFLAGLGVGPTTAVVAGVAGTAIVWAAGSAPAAIVFAASQAVPTIMLVYLASLNRASADGAEWYPAGRIVLAAALLAGACSVLTLFLLGGDIDQVRATLRGILEQFVNTELPKMPDAPVLGPQEIDEATSVALVVLPAATGFSTMAILLFNMWLAGRITLASGRLQRPWPDLAAIAYPVGTPLLFAVATGAGFLAGMPGLIGRGFAGSLFFAYVLLGLAIAHYITRDHPWRTFILFGAYALLLFVNTLAAPALALLGLADSVWPIRKMPASGAPPRS